MQPNPTTFITNLALFSIKAVIVFILLIVGTVVLMPDYTAMSYAIKKAAKEEKVRISLMSFIQNPAALYRLSELDEKDGKLNNAIMSMQLAIGLLEMNNVESSVLKRYRNRLDNLNVQIKNPKELTSGQLSKPGMFNGKPVKRWKE